MLFFFRFRQLFPIYLLVGGMGSADFLQCQHIHNDILRLGNARPTVACHVEGQGSGKMEVGRELFQVAVDALCTVAVLLLLGAVLALDKRQEVWGDVGVCVFVEDAQNVGHDSDLHLRPVLLRV